LVGRKICTAIRHVAFEDLGSFETAFVEAGYEVRYVDVGLDDLDAIAPTASDLLVVLGGPIGVYEQDRYPFLKAELRLIGARLQAKRPTIGICLGAQLMASALGSKVYPCLEKEIGFARMSLMPEGRGSCLSAFEHIPVLHGTEIRSICRPARFAWRRRRRALIKRSHSVGKSSAFSSTQRLERGALNDGSSDTQ
jgi:GMP synthase (glutamine-hydrolysing)